MTTPKSLIFAMVVGFAALLGIQYYGIHTTRSDFEARFSGLQNEMQATHQADAVQVSQLNTDLNLVRDRIGVTAQDIQQARKAADTIKQEQAKATANLRSAMSDQLAEHAKAVEELRSEAGAKLEEVKKDTTTQIGAVTGEVKAVNGQVDSVKTDLDATKTDLAASRREMNDVRDSLGRQIARNSDELGVLKRRGERDYVEFNISKSNTAQRVAGIQLQLNKADTKGQKYDVTLLVDDAKLSKKGQIINEPVQILVGRDRLRYEVVVNSVEKDRIKGYVSTPKDAILSAEGPTLIR